MIVWPLKQSVTLGCPLCLPWLECFLAIAAGPLNIMAAMSATTARIKNMRFTKMTSFLYLRPSVSRLCRFYVYFSTTGTCERVSPKWHTFI